MQTVKEWVRVLFNNHITGHQECATCGTCCEWFGANLRTCKSDLERWRSEGRDDLLRRVSSLGRLWVDPKTGRPARRCPYLKRLADGRSVCAIQDTKPQMCRDYPTLAHDRRCVRGLRIH